MFLQWLEVNEKCDTSNLILVKISIIVEGHLFELFATLSYQGYGFQHFTFIRSRETRVHHTHHSCKQSQNSAYSHDSMPIRPLI